MIQLNLNRVVMSFGESHKKIVWEYSLLRTSMITYKYFVVYLFNMFIRKDRKTISITGLDAISKQTHLLGNWRHRFLLKLGGTLFLGNILKNEGVNVSSDAPKLQWAKGNIEPLSTISYYWTLVFMIVECWRILVCAWSALCGHYSRNMYQVNLLTSFILLFLKNETLKLWFQQIAVLKFVVIGESDQWKYHGGAQTILDS